MDVTQVITTVVVAVLAAAMAVILIKIIDRLRRKDAESEAREIIGDIRSLKSSIENTSSEQEDRPDGNEHK